MASLASAFPVLPGKEEALKRFTQEMAGPRRSDYQASRRRLGITIERSYLQHTPQGDQAIIYLEGDDLQRTFQHLRTAQDPFSVWVRQRTKDLFDGVDLTQTEPRSLSQYVFDGPSAEEDEASSHAREGMEQLGMISP